MKDALIYIDVLHILHQRIKSWEFLGKYCVNCSYIVVKETQGTVINTWLVLWPSSPLLKKVLFFFTFLSVLLLDKYPDTLSAWNHDYQDKEGKSL